MLTAEQWFLKADIPLSKVPAPCPAGITGAFLLVPLGITGWLSGSLREGHTVVSTVSSLGTLLTERKFRYWRGRSSLWESRIDGARSWAGVRALPAPAAAAPCAGLTEETGMRTLAWGPQCPAKHAQDCTGCPWSARWSGTGRCSQLGRPAASRSTNQALGDKEGRRGGKCDAEGKLEQREEAAVRM